MDFLTPESQGVFTEINLTLDFKRISLQAWELCNDEDSWRSNAVLGLDPRVIWSF